MFHVALDVLRDRGAILVEVPALPETDEFPVLLHEFARDLDAYLAALPEGAPIRTMRELVAWNEAHADEALKFGQVLLEKALAVDHEAERVAYEVQRARDLAVAGEHGIDATLAVADAAAIVLPGPYGCSEAARAGYPSLVVPAGYRRENRSAGRDDVRRPGRAARDCCWPWRRRTRRPPRCAGRPRSSTRRCSEASQDRRPLGEQRRQVGRAREHLDVGLRQLVGPPRRRGERLLVELAAPHRRGAAHRGRVEVPGPEEQRGVAQVAGRVAGARPRRGCRRTRPRTAAAARRPPRAARPGTARRGPRRPRRRGRSARATPGTPGAVAPSRPRPCPRTPSRSWRATRPGRARWCGRGTSRRTRRRTARRPTSRAPPPARCPRRRAARRRRGPPRCAWSRWPWTSRSRGG